MVISRSALAASLCLAMLVGCKDSSEFNEDVATGAITSSPMKLEGEQVTLTDPQIHAACKPNTGMLR